MEGRILKLIAALRASGVRVSLAESADAFSAIDQLGVQDRDTFRLSLRATLIKDARDLAVFDKLFPLFFGQGEPPMSNLSSDLTPEEAQQIADALRQMSQRLRARFERLLQGRSLTREELEQLAQMVGLNNVDDLRYQNWMAQRMQRALGFPEVREALEELMQTLSEMGMDSRRLEQIRDLIRQNLQSIGQQVAQFAGERIVENLSAKPPTEGLDDLLNRPFGSLSDREKKLIQREVQRLAAALRTRIALRQKRAKTGQLDAKATLRANLKHQGVPIEIRHRDRTRKPRIVAICDVSTSMRFFSELMLGFLYALQGQVRKMHAFAFIDHLEYISTDFSDGETSEAVSRVLTRMPSGYYNTDLGHSLQNFAHDHLDTLNGRTTLIVVGDGRNNFNDPRLDLFSKMARRSARTIWLNPEPPDKWGSGDSDMHQYAPLCDSVLLVRNLAELTAAVDSLLAA
jgi:uncharacterized protein with von Willebrand factor type A (vWA) domain